MSSKELLGFIQNTSVNDLKCFMITRNLKQGISKNSKNKDKYLFKVYQIGLEHQLRQDLYDATIDELTKLDKKNLTLVEYDIISDDSENLFTYNIEGKNFSFHDVIANQLQDEIPSVTKWEDLDANNIELWAYCLGFENVQKDERVYTFRKSNSNKIVSPQKQNRFFAMFNTKTMALEQFENTAIALDKKIDCIFNNKTFYILQKHNFETLVGLQEEYKEEALMIADKFIENSSFENTSKFKDYVKDKPGLYKKLIKLNKIGGLDNLDENKVKKMVKVSKKYGATISISNGKIDLGDEKSIPNVIKLMCDYYKIGEVTGNAYGTFSGIEIKK